MKCSQLLSGLLLAFTLSMSVSAYADESPADATNPSAATPAPASTDPAAPSQAPQSVVVVGTPEGDSKTAESQSWYSKAWNTAGKHLSDIWEKGDIELYVPFWSYHMPFAYSPEKRSGYTEYPRGGGLGKGWFNESGNWEGIYAMEYQDSHGFPQYQVGYGWIPTWKPLGDQFRVGAGVTAFIFFRQDIGHYAPIPGVLPVLSTGYGPFDVQLAYVPGGQGNGNVIFWWAKYAFR